MAAVLTVAAATGIFAQAQTPAPGGHTPRTPPTPAEMVDRRVQMLTNLLTLDSSQQAQAKTIFTDEITASQALDANTKTTRDALQAAVKSGASDAQLDQLAAQVGIVDGQRTAIHAKAQAKFRLILNSAQKDKLDSTEGRRGPGGPGVAGRGGFGGPPRF